MLRSPSRIAAHGVKVHYIANEVPLWANPRCTATAPAVGAAYKKKRGYQEHLRVGVLEGERMELCSGADDINRGSFLRALAGEDGKAVSKPLPESNAADELHQNKVEDLPASTPSTDSGPKADSLPTLAAASRATTEGVALAEQIPPNAVLSPIPARAIESNCRSPLTSSGVCHICPTDDLATPGSAGVRRRPTRPRGQLWQPEGGHVEDALPAYAPRRSSASQVPSVPSRLGLQSPTPPAKQRRAPRQNVRAARAPALPTSNACAPGLRTVGRTQAAGPSPAPRAATAANRWARTSGPSACSKSTSAWVCVPGGSVHLLFGGFRRGPRCALAPPALPASERASTPRTDKIGGQADEPAMG